MKFLISTFLIPLSLLLSESFGQTVHVNDLDYFVGRFPIENMGAYRVINCTKFSDWFIEKPDEYLPIQKRRPKLRSMQRSKDHHLVANGWPLSRQDGIFRWSGSAQFMPKEYFKCRWYILSDYFGHETCRNALTVWKPISSDSVAFECGLIGPFDVGIGTAEVKRITSFPDGSLLLVVHKYGEEFAKYDFFRGKSHCNLELFYSNQFLPNPRNYDFGHFQRMIYDFDRLVHPSYQLSELTEYCQWVPYPDSLSVSGKVVIDSSTVNVIDLWKMAKDFFKLDSLVDK